jgi:hypothetical protein
VVFLECDANVLALRVDAWVFIVADIAGFSCEDAVVAAEFAVLAGEPRSAALAEDDVARNYIFAWSGISYCCRYIMEWR